MHDNVYNIRNVAREQCTNGPPTYLSCASCNFNLVDMYYEVRTTPGHTLRHGLMGHTELAKVPTPVCPACVVLPYNIQHPPSLLQVGFLPNHMPLPAMLIAELAFGHMLCLWQHMLDRWPMARHGFLLCMALPWPKIVTITLLCY